MGISGIIMVELDRASPVISVFKTLLKGGNAHGLGHLDLRARYKHGLLVLRTLLRVSVLHPGSSSCLHTLSLSWRALYQRLLLRRNQGIEEAGLAL